MKRTAIVALTGTLGILSLASLVGAQTWQDMQSDRDAIHEKQHELRHDRRELNQDLREGDYDAARRERREMRDRAKQLHYERQDLNEDRRHLWNQHHNDDDDD